jgi:hypothetical protein
MRRQLRREQLRRSRRERIAETAHRGDVAFLESEYLGNLRERAARELRTAAPEAQNLSTTARPIRAICLLEHLEWHPIWSKGWQRAGASTRDGSEELLKRPEALLLKVRMVLMEGDDVRATRPQAKGELLKTLRGSVLANHLRSSGRRLDIKRSTMLLELL